MAPVGVIEAPRVQLENGLFRTKKKPTSLPTAALEYPRRGNAKSFIQGGSAKGRWGTRKKLARESCGQGFDLDVIAEALDFGDEAFDLVWLGAALEVIGAEVLIECAVCDHVVGGGEDGSCNGSDSFFGPRRARRRWN